MFVACCDTLGIPGTRYVHYGAWLYVYPVGTVLLTKRTMQTLYVTFEPINSAIDGRSPLNVRSHSGGKTLLYALLVVGSRPCRVLFFSSVFPSAQNASFDVARNRPPSATTGSNQKERRRPRFAPPTCYMIQDVMLCTIMQAKPIVGSCASGGASFCSESSCGEMGLIHIPACVCAVCAVY